MLDYRSRNAQLTIPNNHLAENSLSVDLEIKTEMEIPENQMAMEIDGNDELESILM